MRKPPAGAAISGSEAEGKFSKPSFSTPSASVQVSRPSRIRDAADAAARTKLYLEERTRWLERPEGCRFPLPQDYLLNIAAPSSAEVLAMAGGGA